MMAIFNPRQCQIYIQEAEKPMIEIKKDSNILIEQLVRSVPPEIKNVKRWILWRYEDSKTCKPTKVP